VAQDWDVNPKNFFAELKRRNVYKVAIAYGVVDIAGVVAIAVRDDSPMKE